jgi:oligoribonuclease
VSDEKLPDKMVWIDTETTGLADDAVVLELGFVVTDIYLNELWSHSWLIHPPTTYSDLVLSMDNYVQEMHHKNGLLHDLSEAWNTGKLDGPQTVELQAIALLGAAGIEPGKNPLCGSTAHFDRRMIAHNLPKLEAYFHYRNIDVSSIKELAKMFAPGVFKTRPGQEESDKKHRVLDDVRASLAELQHYIDAGFIVPEEGWFHAGV